MACEHDYMEHSIVSNYPKDICPEGLAIHAPAILIALMLFSMTAMAEDDDGLQDDAEITTQVLDVPFPPDFSASDENGVDMISGRTRFGVGGARIGSGSMTLEHSIFSDTNGFIALNPFIDSFSGGLGRLVELGDFTACGPASPYLVRFADVVERFCLVDGEFESVLKRGSMLVDNGDDTFTYTDRNGVRYTIETRFTNPASAWGHIGLISKARFPDGRVLEVHHKNVTYISSQTGQPRQVRRVQSVTANNGLQIKYRYDVNSEPTDKSELAWRRPIGVVAINNAIEYCEPMADTCELEHHWPSATYIWSGGDRILTVTDSAGQVTRYTHDEYRRVVGVKPPSSASADKASYDYCPPFPMAGECQVTICSGGIGSCSSFTITDRVRGSVRDGQVWTYEYTTGIGSGGISVYESRHPLGHRMDLLSAANTGNARKLVDRFGKQHFFSLDSTNRLVETHEPSGLIVSYTYDDRGNLLAVWEGASGNLESQLLYRAEYPATCDNPITCNKPIWSEDAKGNRTDYEYDPVHGGVLSVTGPSVNGVRPQTRFEYEQRYAWYMNQTELARAPEPIWVLISESFCRPIAATADGCSAPKDEVRTVYEYGPAGPNNLFLRGVIEVADGTSLRTCYSYDRMGNQISETQPAAGLASCE